MATIPATAHFGLTTRFDVVVDGFPLGGWAKCEGLSVTFELEKYTPLGHNDYLPVLPNRVVYDRITLTRAITAEDSPTVMSWLSQMASSGGGGTAEITLLDSHREKVTSWKLRGVYPTKWKGPTFDANSHNIAIETLELAHEGFLGD
jgi:phage tail-like protein